MCSFPLFWNLWFISERSPYAQSRPLEVQCWNNWNVPWDVISVWHPCKGSRIPEKGIRIKIRSFWQIFLGPLYMNVFRAQQTVTQRIKTLASLHREKQDKLTKFVNPVLTVSYIQINFPQINHLKVSSHIGLHHPASLFWTAQKIELNECLLGW